MNELLAWPTLSILVLGALREIVRLLGYVIGLAIVVRGTTPGDRSAVLDAYDRSRFDLGVRQPVRRRGRSQR